MKFKFGLNFNITSSNDVTLKFRSFEKVGTVELLLRVFIGINKISYYCKDRKTNNKVSVKTYTPASIFRYFDLSKPNNIDDIELEIYFPIKYKNLAYDILESEETSTFLKKGILRYLHTVNITPDIGILFNFFPKMFIEGGYSSEVDLCKCATKTFFNEKTYKKNLSCNSNINIEENTFFSLAVGLFLRTDCKINSLIQEFIFMELCKYYQNCGNLKDTIFYLLEKLFMNIYTKFRSIPQFVPREILEFYFNNHLQMSIHLVFAIKDRISKEHKEFGLKNNIFYIP